MEETVEVKQNKRVKERKIKCLVWDLDNTLWRGTLVEDPDVELDPRAEAAVKTLDQRGILQSIASKNDADLAMAKLKQFGLDQYFIYPEIHWGAKSESIERIVKSINIGKDTVAFIDDQPFEREEVGYNHPEVMCIDAAALTDLVKMDELNPRFITSDSAKRREMYQADITRNNLEEHYEGPKEEFLATLDMVFEIGPARQEDLKRAEELTMRTNQLNTTGYTYSYEELDALRHDPNHKLLIAGLDDKYGTYGRIGLTLVEIKPQAWVIKLLLMSCRVMARGVGTIMINHLKREAKKQGVALQAEFIHTDRNRMMFMTYRFAGFREVEKQGDSLLLEADLTTIPEDPGYVTVNVTA